MHPCELEERGRADAVADILQRLQLIHGFLQPCDIDGLALVLFFRFRVNHSGQFQEGHLAFVNAAAVAKLAQDGGCFFAFAAFPQHQAVDFHCPGELRELIFVRRCGGDFGKIDFIGFIGFVELFAGCGHFGFQEDGVKKVI